MNIICTFIPYNWTIDDGRKRNSKLPLFQVCTSDLTLQIRLTFMYNATAPPTLLLHSDNIMIIISERWIIIIGCPCL